MRTAGRGGAGGFVVLVLVLVLAGCGRTDVAQSAVTTAEVRPDASCLDPVVLEALGLELDPSLRSTAPVAATTRGLPPTSFVVDTALLCDRGETLRDSAGRWWAVTSTRLEGDLGPLVGAATRAPTVCGPGIVAQVWLVDAMGEAVLLPRDAACGGDDLFAALAELEVVDRIEHPVALAQPVTAQAPDS